MESNYLISYSRIKHDPLNKVLWALRQFGITYQIDYANDDQITIEYQDENFELNYTEELPFEGSCMMVKGPKLSGTSYIRRGLIELISLIIRTEYEIKDYETVILNSSEFKILKENYYPDVISKKLYFEHNNQSHLNLELIQHETLKDNYKRFEANKYSIEKTKTKDQLFALHSISVKGEIEYQDSTFLKIDQNEFVKNIETVSTKSKIENVKNFLAIDTTNETKILRIRFDYDHLDGLYFINTNDKFILIEFWEQIGQ